MFSKILTSAVFAGFAAGLIAAALQLFFVQPVLLHAELFESGQLVHFGAGAGTGDAGVSHGFDMMRDGLSILFSALVYVGYGLILVAIMALASERGTTITARSGMIWGIAGFVTVQFAPAFGLSPELPGSMAADLTDRQIWWFGTVAATGVGMGLIGFGKSWPAWAIAVLLILAPHFIGAPHLDGFAGPVPPELAAEYAARALGVGLVAWTCLGLLAGYFWQKETSD